MAITAASNAPTTIRARGGQERIPARLIRRIEAEYLEMPGLTLTPRQAARLWALDIGQVEALLAALIDRGFLVRDGRGAYRRRDCPRCS